MSIFTAACRPGPLRPLIPSLARALAAAAAGFGGWTSSYPTSALAGQGGWLIAGRRGRARGIVVGWRGRVPPWARRLPAERDRHPATRSFGVRRNSDGSLGPALTVMLLPGNHAVLAALQSAIPWLSPVPAGRGPSLGMGDRTGYATPGHVLDLGSSRLFPVFAQQSVREMTRTGRSPDDVMDDAVFGVLAAGWRRGWGADADHLKVGADIDRMAAAGFVRFTLDASPALRPGAERLATPADRFGPAVPFLAKLARRVRRAMGRNPFEIEVSLDELPVETRPEDHEFVVRALAARAVRVCAVAPRFPGSFEKGVGYRGSRSAFRRALAAHVAVARRCGGYAISVHSGSDKFTVYRDVARITRGRFHVKTAGTSWLEALRVVARRDPALFREVVACARLVFPAARLSYHVSATLRDIPTPRRVSDRRLESVYLDRPFPRQILHVAFGSILGTFDDKGFVFRDRIHRILALNESVHRAVLVRHLGRHVRLLRP